MPNNNSFGPGGRSRIFGGTDGSGSYVEGEMLKEVSVPNETLLGAANGALSGAVLSSGVSALVTAAKHEGSMRGVGRQILKDLIGSHKFPVIGGTVALAALGGVVRHSRAIKHNEWSEKYFSILEAHANERNHADAVTESRNPENTNPAR